MQEVFVAKYSSIFENDERGNIKVKTGDIRVELYRVMIQ